MNDFPPCFGSKETWEIWLNNAKSSGVQDPETNFCIDCTPQYQELAVTYNVCARPATFFLHVVNDDGDAEIVGISLPDD